MRSKLSVYLGSSYDGLARGKGRWYPAVDSTGTPYGYVWTDDRERMGIIDIRTGPIAEAALSIFFSQRNEWASNDLSASAAFDESMSIQKEAYGIDTEFSEGDLYTDLVLGITEKELKTMAKTRIYSITVRADGEVLELIRSDIDGMAYREDGAWIPVSLEATKEDYPTIYGQEWHDVKDKAVPYYDAHIDDRITKAEMQQFFKNYDILTEK